MYQVDREHVYWFQEIETNKKDETDVEKFCTIIFQNV